ncbi:MAG: hypothetical protein ACPG7T_09215, partial [Ilumatobacteraceae bacterium]
MGAPEIARMMREEDAMSGSEVDGGTELVSGGGIPGDAEPDESTAASVTELSRSIRATAAP